MEKHSKILVIISYKKEETPLVSKPRTGKYSKKRIPKRLDIEVDNDYDESNVKECNTKIKKHVTFGQSEYGVFESLSDSTEGRYWTELRTLYPINYATAMDAGGTRKFADDELKAIDELMAIDDY